ncbi:MAG: response regulator transcription factor [Acidobacteriota bacterium]
MRQSFLIVDDMPDMLRFLERVIRRELNVDVLTAGNGEEALSMVTGDMTSIALIDIRMPKMDGMELLRRIKKINDTVIVIMRTSSNGKCYDCHVQELPVL